MRLNKQVITITATTAKTGTGYTSPINGLVHAIQYIKPASGALSSTANLSITTEGTSMKVLSSLTVGAASFLKFPRNTTVNTTNAASTGSAAIPVVDERIKVSVTATSAALLTGTYNIFIEGTANDG